MSQMSIDELQQKAIDVLGEHPDGLSYRELLSAVSRQFPSVDRAYLSSVLGELPKSRSDAVWRPKPGLFKIRAEGEGPTVYARGRKRRQPAEPSAGRTAWPERPLPNRIENLLKLGFVEVGEWKRAADGVECVYSSEVDLKHALLAYAMTGSVVYIGRPQRNLPARAGYVNRSIRNALSRDRSVKVFALAEWEICEHRGLKVNVGAGIEDELVERMQPPWNNYPA